MNPRQQQQQQYARVMQLVEVLMDCAPDELEARLSRECAGDEALRREVEKLLAQDKPESNFLEESPLNVLSSPRADDGGDAFIGSRVGSYRITEEIGRGGMGAVYKAVRDDEQYHTEVAVKLVKRGMDTDFILRRFRNERQILANLNHPHIAHLLDGGTTPDGLPYFVMEYIEGRPLDEYCEGEKLSTSERLKLFQAVCSAVEYAHQHQVIHRDLKPSNILVTEDGTPKLLDFGIAKILRSDSAGQNTEATAAVFRVMTPEYASPEQFKGDPATTASDVYSLGVLLYELLTGQRPYRFKSRQPHEMARVICEAQPLKPSAAVSRSVTASRPESASSSSSNGNPRSGRRETAENSLARQTESDGGTARVGASRKLRRRLRGDLDNIVLTAMSKEPERRYATVAELAEDIGRHLSGLPVRASKSTLANRGAAFVRRSFRRDRRALASLLIALALLIGATGLFARWRASRAAASSTAPAENIGGTQNAQAREAYLLGRFFWNKRTPDGYTRAIEQHNQAIALDPNYASAYAGLADAYAMLACVREQFEHRHERMRIAKEHAQHALRIDERTAEAHATLGFIGWHYDWDWENSERELRRAIELRPDYVTAHHWYAYLLIALNRGDEAVAEIRRAREIDPLSLIINSDVAEILSWARRYDEAIEQAQRTIEMDPSHYAAGHARRIWLDCLFGKRMYREYLAEFEREAAQSNRAPGALRNLATVYFHLGYRDKGQRILNELGRRGESTEIDRYLAFRETDGVFAGFDSAFEYRTGNMAHLLVNPYFDGIRSDPRYADIVRRIGLP